MLRSLTLCGLHDLLNRAWPRLSSSQNNKHVATIVCDVVAAEVRAKRSCNIYAVLAYRHHIRPQVAENRGSEIFLCHLFLVGAKTTPKGVVLDHAPVLYRQQQICTPSLSSFVWLYFCVPELKSEAGEVQRVEIFSQSVQASLGGS